MNNPSPTPDVPPSSTIPKPAGPFPTSAILPPPAAPAGPAAAATPAGPNRSAASQVKLNSAIGTLDLLSEAEQAELFACETVIQSGRENITQNFVQIGLAFGTVEEHHLYRNDFGSFGGYCRGKWDIGPRQAQYLIAAARVFSDLRTNCAEQLPDHESQLRPLARLKPEQARAAWKRAVEKAAGRRITARLVQSVVQELHFQEPKPAKNGPTRADLRGMVDDAMSQLLAVIMQKSGHDVLLQKAEALHGHIRALWKNLSGKQQPAAGEVKS